MRSEEVKKLVEGLTEQQAQRVLLSIRYLLDIFDRVEAKYIAEIARLQAQAQAK